MTSEIEIGRGVHDPHAWRDLVTSRLSQIAEFLAWAKSREADGNETSLRLRNRGDLDRCRAVLPLFDTPWWGVTVYSCFDSETGATVAAQAFSKPLPVGHAEAALDQLDFPRASVQYHRAQSALRGARLSLLSACEKVDAIRGVLFANGLSFDERYEELRRVKVSWWGRTTWFDVLQRSGCLGVSGVRYRPEKAYLDGSTGPSAGFAYIWGTKVSSKNADQCEEVLERWSVDWDEIATMAGVRWQGERYDSADFENALCMFHRLGIKTPGRPAATGRSAPTRSQ